MKEEILGQSNSNQKFELGVLNQAAVPESQSLFIIFDKCGVKRIRNPESSFE